MVDKLEGAGPLDFQGTPANGEQVERAFRAGWEQACITVDPCNGFHEEDYAEARSEILATLSTPTEDARERVLGEARKSAKALRDAAARSVKSGHRQAHLNLEMMAVALDRIDTALGNKETDRHG